jgi:hypothetical protein
MWVNALGRHICPITIWQEMDDTVQFGVSVNRATAVDKVDFYKNLIDASSIEQRFIFLDDEGYLPAPKRLSTAGAGAAQAAIYAGAAVKFYDL